MKEEVLLKLVENSIRLYRDMTGGIFKAACALRTNQVNKNEIVNCDSKILELQEEKAKYSRLVLTLSDNLVKGIINKEDYEMFRKKYMDHMEEIEESIKAQEAYVSEILEHKFLCDQWMEKFLEMPDIGKIDRDLVLRYIEKIIVYEDKKIDIRFRFQDELEIASRVAEKLNRTVRTVEDV